MRHPVLANNGTIGIYWLVGLILIALDYMVIRYGFKASCSVAIINAIVYNTIILLLALSLWYPAFYLDKNKGLVYNCIQFAFTGAIFLGIWYVVCHLLIYSIEYIFHIDLSVLSGYPMVRILTSSFIFLLFLSVYFVLIYYDSLQEQKEKQAKMAGLLKEAELSILKSQLNPHFLFNSLNSISSLTITQPESARKMINELSDFLRYSLRNNKELLMLNEEVNNVLRYIAIEKVRFGDKIIFESYIADECKQKKLPALILQPLFENAIKYGVYESIDPVLVKIVGKMDKGDLIISVENEYEKQSQSHRGEGIGLNNIKNRMLNIYNKSDLVNICQTNTLFKVELTFPQMLSTGKADGNNRIFIA